MAHPFPQLQPEYDRLLATMRVTRPDAVVRAADKVIRNFDRYGDASVETLVPSPFVGTLDLRESDCDPRAALGQGDPWNQVSTHVPRGNGPWRSWKDAAVFYINHDHLNDITVPWSMAYACWKGEIWNGFGPRNHGIFTGYLWAGTNHYTRGKYVADSVWDPGHVDEQLGIIPVILRIAELFPSVAIGQPIVPSGEAPPLVPMSAPFGLTGTAWIQRSLNTLMPADDDLLVVDGNYGRHTREAVRNFQLRHPPLTPDGLAGDLTTAAMDAELARLPKGAIA